MSNDAEKLIELGLAVVDTERQAVAALSQRIDHHFVKACEFILNCQGRIIITGMGKSGHISNKIAATMASTGTPAFFVHPGEASHGDLGMITTADCVIAISNSGESEEILTIIPILKRLGVPMIAMSSNPESSLGQVADVHLDISVAKEACPLGLAPTSSTTATLVMGDALAVAVLEAKGFTAEDFARSHPGGRLGRRLLLHVNDVMHRDERLPMVSPAALLPEALLIMSRQGLGMTTIVDAKQQLLGIFTDGDLRRALDDKHDLHNTPIHTLMTQECATVSPETLAVDALKIMEQRKISAIPVVDTQQRLVGAIHMHDLLAAGV